MAATPLGVDASAVVGVNRERIIPITLYNICQANLLYGASKPAWASDPRNTLSLQHWAGESRANPFSSCPPQIGRQKQQMIAATPSFEPSGILVRFHKTDLVPFKKLEGIAGLEGKHQDEYGGLLSTKACPAAIILPQKRMGGNSCFWGAPTAIRGGSCRAALPATIRRMASSLPADVLFTFTCYNLNQMYTKKRNLNAA